MILSDNYLDYQLRDIATMEDPYCLVGHPATIRMNLRLTKDEKDYIRRVDIASVVASSFYSDGLLYMSGIVHGVVAY